MALTPDQIVRMSTEVSELLQAQIEHLEENDAAEYLSILGQAFSVWVPKNG